MNWKEFFRPTSSKIFATMLFLLLSPYVERFFLEQAYKHLPDNHLGAYISDKLDILGYFLLFMYLLLLTTNYAFSCLIFYHFKPHKISYVLLFPFVIISTYIFSALLSQFIHKKAAYCYDSSYFSGFIGRYGVPNMMCTCFGVVIGDCKLHATCEGGTNKCVGYAKPVYCYGPRKFSTLSEWNKYCNNLGEKEIKHGLTEKDCLKELTLTRQKENETYEERSRFK